MELRAGDFVPYGLDTGIILMADEESINSLVNLNTENLPYVWAVDVDFDPQTKTYPEGYDGLFKVRIPALLQHLYVALGSGLYAPVDVWQMIQKQNPSQLVKHEEF